MDMMKTTSSGSYQSTDSEAFWLNVVENRFCFCFSFRLASVFVPLVAVGRCGVVPVVFVLLMGMSPAAWL